MTDIPDVELTDEQDDRATALERDVMARPATAACLIVHLQDEIERLTACLVAANALDELRQPAPRADLWRLAASAYKDGYGELPGDPRDYSDETRAMVGRLAPTTGDGNAR